MLAKSKGNIPRELLDRLAQLRALNGASLTVSWCWGFPAAGGHLVYLATQSGADGSEREEEGSLADADAVAFIKRIASL